MDIKFNSGALFMNTGNGSVALGNGLLECTAETVNHKESNELLFNLKKQPSMSFEVEAVDLDLFDRFFSNSVPTSGFTLEYERPIMVQARWHKKARVRKKWLKRFGMKPDVVKLKAEASAITYDTNIEEFEFETNHLKYIWRPDQKRKGLKIEW